MFATTTTLQLFQTCKCIFIDGTFRMSPRLWKQILIINVELADNVSFPVLFAFLPDKKKETYKKAFQEMKHLLEEHGLGELAAVQAMADFESAIRTSWSEVFPKIPLKNCLFHFNKVRPFILNISLMRFL